MEISVFLRKKANFTENVTAVKSWIRLVPNDQFTLSDPTWQMPSFVASDGMNSERKCADKIGTVLVLWAGHFLR